MAMRPANKRPAEVLVSAVVPVLNDAEPLAVLLEGLTACEGLEVIVVDGGSRDDPAAVCRRFGVACIAAPRGRAAQLRAGIARARGETIWLLHADAAATAAHFEALLGVAGANVWGRFDVRLAGREPALGVIGWCMNQRSWLAGICTGDQGIFVGCALLDAVGGVPDQALMEDIELSKRLRRLAHPRRLRMPLPVSARRWERDGILPTVLLMWGLRLRYFLGALPEHLAGRYYPRPRIAVLARSPERGAVKRRLAAALGEGPAFDAHVELVEGTLAALHGGEFDCDLWFAGVHNAALGDWGRRFGVRLLRQPETDLGGRMLAALRGGAQLVVGTDIPDLTAGYIEVALDALERADVVVGPVEDGGYCLIGMTKPRAALFEDIAWGGGDVCEYTLAKAANLGLKVVTLETLYDVDDADDHRRWQAAKAGRAAVADAAGA